MPKPIESISKATRTIGTARWWNFISASPAPDPSVRNLAYRLHPAVDQRLIFVRPIFRQAVRGEPRAVHALRAEMVLRLEARRIVERADRQVHIVAVEKGEAERRPAFPAIRPPRDRRGGVPVGLV